MSWHHEWFKEYTGKDMKVRIWSFEHDAWWKPNNIGYTKNIEEAGIYDRKEAEQIVKNANRYSKEPQEKIVEIEDTEIIGSVK